MALDVPGGSGGEGENGIVGKAGEQGGVVCKGEGGRWLWRGEGVEVLSGAGIPKSERLMIAGGSQGAAVGREGEGYERRGLVFSGFGLVGFEGFLRGEEPGLGFSDLCLNGEEVFGGGGAVLEREFVGVAGLTELRAVGIAFLASLVEFVSDFFEIRWFFLGCFGGVENEMLALQGAFFLIEFVAGFGEGRGVGL